MEKIIILVIKFSLVLVPAVTIFGQTERKSPKISKTVSQKKVSVPFCSENSDKLYDRQKVLEQLADNLNRSIPSYSKIFDQGFGVENGRGNFFFVYDITDTSNRSDAQATCIDFKNNHIYHFAPYRISFSYSHILILEDGKLKIFKSIDCWNKGNHLEDVISYVSKKLENNTNKNEIIERVKNYRKYGRYFYEDKPPLSCKGYEIGNEM